MKREEAATVRCPCGEKEPGRWWLAEKKKKGKGMKKPPKVPFIKCETCDMWQHAVCVGLSEVEKANPNPYHCEECKPQQHRRFKHSDDTDNRAEITKQRLDMHLDLDANNPNEVEGGIKWLVDEIMAIVETYGEALEVPWCNASGLGKPWFEDDFHAKILTSFRMVLYNADIPNLEALRAQMTKVWFGEARVAAVVLYEPMKAWLDAAFMTKMENDDGRAWMEANAEGMEGMDGVGRANAKLVRKYFNLQ